jgi:hypothetical protein
MSDIEQAIADRTEGCIVTKWLIIAEVIDNTGERVLKLLADEEITTWDRLGMLQVATSRAYARLRGGS